MRGWKTWVTAITSIAWGLGGLIGDVHGPDACAAFVTGGFALIGIGHKVEKLADLFQPVLPDQAKPEPPKH